MNRINHFSRLLREAPQAAAAVRGNGIEVNVRFYSLRDGVLVVAEGGGLPYKAGKCGGAVLGFHIHSGSDCGRRGEDMFGDAMSHYDKNGCPHPFHAGDMPPLFSNGGYAFSAFFTDRFTVSEIIGKTVIIHSQPDDFVTQPSGNSGEKLACGVIRSTRS